MTKTHLYSIPISNRLTLRFTTQHFDFYMTFCGSSRVPSMVFAVESASLPLLKHNK